MKIIYGITKSNFGGAQRYVYDLSSEAKKLGHDVSVIVGGHGSLIEKLKGKGIRVMTVPHLQRDISLVEELRSLHFLFRTLYDEKPQVFHTNSSKMGGVGNLAARFAGVQKIIFTAHGWAWNEPRPAWERIPIKLLAWLTIMLSHQTICVSEKTKRDVSRWPFIKHKLRVVRNGVDKFELLPRGEARRALGIHDDSILTVGTLSELHPVKGLDILLEAWEKFSRKSEATLLLVGDGEIRENLEDFAEHLGISHKVRFKGYLENARSYLLAFDILCLPSRSEALPYTLLEAGLAARPVIATAVGGIPEVIENGLNGALVPPDDSETLFSTLLLLSEDEALRGRLGENLKKAVINEFSLKEMVDQTWKSYHHLP